MPRIYKGTLHREEFLDFEVSEDDLFPDEENRDMPLSDALKEYHQDMWDGDNVTFDEDVWSMSYVTVD